MKKLIIGCFLLCLVSQYSIAQNQSLLRDAEAYSKAMINSDFETMIQLTNSQQIDVSGGPSYFVKDLEAEHKVRSSYMKFKDVMIQADEEPVVYLQQLQTIITQEFLVDFSGEEFKVYQHLFAASDDKGENWTFIDLTQHDAQSVVEFFPTISKDLKFPEAKEAVLVEK